MTQDGTPAPGRWTCLVPTRPGQLLLHRKLCSPLEQVGPSLVVLLMAGSLVANRAQNGVPGYVLGGVFLALFGFLAAEKVMNEVNLQLVHGQLQLERGPIPRWRKQSFPIEWIARVEVIPPETREDKPLLQLMLTNGEAKRLHLEGCSLEEVCFAAAQAHAALALDRPPHA